MHFTTQPTQFGLAVYVHDIDLKLLDVAMERIGYTVASAEMGAIMWLHADRYYYHPVFGFACLKGGVIEAVGSAAQKHLQMIVIKQDSEIIWHV